MIASKLQKFFFAQKGLVFNKDFDALLFIKTRSKYMPEKLDGKLALPGGKVDFGEDIDAACIREIKEETGLLVKPHLPVYTWGWTYKKDAEDVEIVANARICTYVSGEIFDNEKSEKEVVIEKVLWAPLPNIKYTDCVSDEWPAIQFVLSNMDLVKTIAGLKNITKEKMYMG